MFNHRTKGYVVLCQEKVQTTLSTYSHLYPNKHQEVVDMMQNQHQKDMVTSDVTAPAETSEEPKPQGTRFKVVSPKDKTSPQQVHENDLSPCVGFNRRIQKGSTPCKQRAEPIKSIDTQKVFNYSMIVATLPEPTVRPPSRD